VRQLLEAELLKLRTTRTFAVLVACAVGLSMLLVVLVTTLDDGFTEDDIRETFLGDFTSLFILLLGVMGMAGEWRHRTITSSVLAAPDRARLLGAKVLAYATAGAVLSLLVTVSIYVVGSIILSARDEVTLGIGDFADVLWRNLVVAAFFGALGVTIGGIVRNQVAAIVGVLIALLIVEPTVVALAPDVGKFLPLQGAPSGLIDVEFDDDEELLAPAAALLVMIGWIGATYAAAAALLRSRDLT
jgi:ABC-2 type transport system permease protein